MITTTKYIIVIGSVMSGIGKGVIASSIGNLLINAGHSVSIMKCDPYINIDPGTLNPKQHGEVFVTYDGGEVDLDFGHYERFLGTPVSKLGSITTGSIYNSVITKERAGKYEGNTVQIFHITQEIKDRIYKYSSQTNSEFVIIEIGGTVGDLESIPFFEAARQIQLENKYNNVCFVHCTYVFYLSSVGEFKTKPSQHSTKLLNSYGITPDILIARSEDSLDENIITKLSKYCYINSTNIIPCPDVFSVYQVPLVLKQGGILDILSRKFETSISPTLKTSYFDDMAIHSIKLTSYKGTQTFKVVIVGKYTKLKDSYISIHEALTHAALYLNKEILIHYLDIYDVNYKNIFDSYNNSKIDAVVVPGGFGVEGTSQIISLLKLCRKKKIKTLGICLGMQLMCIEYFSSTLHLPFTSTEFNEQTQYPLFDLLENQVHGVKGGSLKLGTYPTKLQQNTLIYSLYKHSLIYERYRHRYEFNNKYRDLFNEDFIFSGSTPDNALISTVELNKNKHPFYVGTQFHPEFISTLVKPHPLFVGLLC